MIEIIMQNIDYILVFFLGMIIGFVLGIIFKTDGKTTGVWSMVISIIVVVVWVASMGLDLMRGEKDTTLFLHLFFGTVLGVSNPAMRELMLSIIEKIRK